MTTMVVFVYVVFSHGIERFEHALAPSYNARRCMIKATVLAKEVTRNRYLVHSFGCEERDVLMS